MTGNLIREVRPAVLECPEQAQGALMQKFVLILAAVILFGSNSLAQTPPALTPSPLKSAMHQIGELFSQIHLNIGDPSQNQSSADASGQLVVLFTQASQMVPDKVGTLPAAQQTAAIVDFKTLIQQEIVTATEMQNAFLKNDNAAAQVAYSKMNLLKRSGHTEFKPPALQ